MKTAVAGYPRIGTLRELKFALEKYFRKEISADELTQTAKELRKTHWLIQKEAGIDYITSNDFSYYDIVLDTAFLLNIIPERYKELEVSELDKYLAMARGYQGENGDVKALAMKKWFNTNYHYIVPEAEDSTQIRLTGNKLWAEYAEAKELGIETKPVITGVYTLFKLCRFTGKKRADDFINAFIEAYKYHIPLPCKGIGIKRFLNLIHYPSKELAETLCELWDEDIDGEKKLADKSVPLKFNYLFFKNVPKSIIWIEGYLSLKQVPAICFFIIQAKLSAIFYRFHKGSILRDFKIFLRQNNNVKNLHIKR